VLTSPPTAAGDGANVDVFVRGTDGAMWGLRLAPSGLTSPWQSLGGYLSSDPIAISEGGNLVVDVFVRGGDNAMYAMQITTGSKTNWIPLGGSLSSAPIATSDRFGVEVFARDGDLAEWWMPLRGADVSALSSGEGLAERNDPFADAPKVPFEPPSR
jgi:hypothetical protein